MLLCCGCQGPPERFSGTQPSKPNRNIKRQPSRASSTCMRLNACMHVLCLKSVKTLTLVAHTSFAEPQLFSFGEAARAPKCGDSPMSKAGDRLRGRPDPEATIRPFRTTGGSFMLSLPQLSALINDGHNDLFCIVCFVATPNSQANIGQSALGRV